MLGFTYFTPIDIQSWFLHIDFQKLYYFWLFFLIFKLVVKGKKKHIDKKQVINVKLLALWHKKVPHKWFLVFEQDFMFLSPWNNVLWYFIEKTKLGSISCSMLLYFIEKIKMGSISQNIQTGLTWTFSTLGCNFKMFNARN